jgi:hypothetical protein
MRGSHPRKTPEPRSATASTEYVAIIDQGPNLWAKRERHKKTAQPPQAGQPHIVQPQPTSSYCAELYHFSAGCQVGRQPFIVPPYQRHGRPNTRRTLGEYEASGRVPDCYPGSPTHHRPEDRDFVVVTQPGLQPDSQPLARAPCPGQQGPGPSRPSRQRPHWGLGLRSQRPQS